MKINLDSIDKQFRFNRGKNLFFEGILNSLGFVPETLDSLEKIGTIDKESEEMLINYLTDRAIKEFCGVNQYFTFDRKAQLQLHDLYTHLFETVKSGSLPVEDIAGYHYENLIKWLQSTNSFAEAIYENKGELLESVVCSEYSPELQLEILHLDLAEMKEPLLDVGCGEKAGLVQYLRSLGIDAYGIDRFAADELPLKQIDWMEFRFEKDYWGTIVSHLGFSNHFHHHHLRQDGNFLEYARKYMDMLASLKPDGSFHYVPDLPYMEEYLEKGKYQLFKYGIRDLEFKSSAVRRIE